VATSCRGHDLLLYAAGATFFASIALVPLLLLALWLSGHLAGAGTVQHLAAVLGGTLPTGAGAKAATRFLADAGTRLRPSQALAALLPATAYGEGLVRAFDRLSRHGEPGRRPLRGRLGTLVGLALSPLLLLSGLGAAGGLSHRLGKGLPATLIGVYLAFLVGWVLTSVLLVLAYRGLSAERARIRSVLWGAFSTGSFVAGTALGLLLLLSLHLSLGSAYGGSQALAVVAVSLVWLYALHVLVLAGYVLTLRLDARHGHPRAAPVEPSVVRPAA
jgi:membrane protein